MTGYYENHIGIRKNKLCPFKLKLCDEARPSPCNWHSNVEIICVIGGRGTMQYATDRLELEEGDLAIVNSGTLHHMHNAVGFLYYYLIIDEEFCKENGLELSALSFEKKVTDGETRMKFLDVVKTASEYAKDESALSTAKLRSAVLSLIIELCAKHVAKNSDVAGNPSSSEQYVKRVLERLNENCAERVSLEELAEECGITKYHLAREFKRYTGQTVFTYINVMRCKKAELCIRDGMSITEAAYECGFESLSYFSRTYKKLMGVAPSLGHGGANA